MLMLLLRGADGPGPWSFEADMKYLEPESRKEMESALVRFPKINVVYAHDDPGAHGA
jgi:ribose transport system substrate-binding protein